MSDHNSQTPWTDLSQTLIRKLGRTTGNGTVQSSRQSWVHPTVFYKKSFIFYIVTLHIFTDYYQFLIFIHKRLFLGLFEILKYSFFGNLFI